MKIMMENILMRKKDTKENFIKKSILDHLKYFQKEKIEIQKSHLILEKVQVPGNIKTKGKIF